MINRFQALHSASTCAPSAWLGIALAAQQLNALLVAVGMASYLAGRAVAQSDWYDTKFPKEYAALGRKNMVPFLF
jgi:hypothetical protein